MNINNQLINHDILNNIELRSDIENDENPQELSFYKCGKTANSPEQWTIECSDITTGEWINDYTYDSYTEYIEDCLILGIV